MGLARFLCVTLVATVGCNGEDDLDIGTTEQAVDVGLPISIPPPSVIGDDPSALAMYGWEPDFSVNIPGFDSLNRAYIRDRFDDQDDIPGTLQRLRSGSWQQQDFETTLRAYFPSCGFDCSICYRRGGGWYNAQIVFDRDDHAYTVIQAKAVHYPDVCLPEESFPVLMLHSADLGRTVTAPTWNVLELSPETAGDKRFAMERPFSPEPLEGPPAVLLFRRENVASACGLSADEPYPDPIRSPTPGDYGRLRVIKPLFDAQGVLIASQPADLSSEALHIDSHSGGGTQVLTYGGKIYVVWGDRQNPQLLDACKASCINQPASCLDGCEQACAEAGSPVSAAKYGLVQNGSQWDLIAEEPNPAFTVTLPTNDGHNRNSLVVDTSGYLHVVTGAHNCPFRYAKATSPSSVSFGTMTPTIPGADIESCPPNDAQAARQTYAAFVRDRDNRLHLVYRRSFGSSANTYRLVYQRKTATGSWTTNPKNLVAPPHAGYAVYHHQMTIDRYGHLYLLLNYWTDVLPASVWFPGAEEDSRYKNSVVLLSLTNGGDWLAGGAAHGEGAQTQTFADATWWLPSSGWMGDLDGNGRKDVVHVFFDQGLHARIDDWVGGSELWRGRGRQLTNGTEQLAFPVLVGNVNGAAGDNDNRDDIVFVYRHATNLRLQIRTHFTQTNGAFLPTLSSTTDPLKYFPDTNHPKLVPLMGDVNGDGRSDIVLMARTQDDCGANGLNIRLKTSLGNGTWATNDECHPLDNGVDPATPLTIHTFKYSPILAKVDTDYDDLVFVYRQLGGDGIPGTADDGALETMVKRYNGGGTWTWGTHQTHSDGWQIHEYPHVMGDVNGDGRSDLIFLFHYWVNGNFAIRVKFANGSGSYGTFGSSVHREPAGASDIPANYTQYKPFTARVNSDFCADVVFPYRGTDGQYRIKVFYPECAVPMLPDWQWSVETKLMP